MNLRLFFNKKLVFALLTIAGIVFVQAQSITGQVLDDFDFPVEGVLIQEEGNESNSTTTDIEGYFEITVNPGASLSISGEGYTDQTIPVGNSTNLTVRVEELIDLEETLVVAYGTTSRDAFTGSASVITEKDLEQRNVTSPIAALEGRATGVQFTSPSGPGASPGIVVRGVGTLNGGTNPLYIVDGIQYNGALNTLNQEDIQSITVLKDAASTSLYGSRAANGVVIITTKRGTKGSLKVNASMQTGFLSRGVDLYEQVSPGQYYEAMWEALKNSPAGNGDAQFASDNIYNQLGYNPFNVPNDQIVGVDGRLNPNAEVVYQSLDWFDSFERTGTRRNYNVNIAGGGEDHSVFFSASYLDEEYYVVNSSFDRLTTRINADFDVSDRLKLGGSANLALTDARGPSSAGTNSIVNPFGFALGVGSVYPVFVNDQQGNIVLDDFGNPLFDSGEGFPEFNIGSRPTNQGRHAIQELILNRELDENNTFGFRFFGELEIINDLKLIVNYGRDYNELFESEYENEVIGDAQPDGRLSQTRGRREIENFNQYLTYIKKIGNHKIDFTAGHESFERIFSDMDGLATVQAANGIFEFANFSNIVRLDGATFEKAIESYFGRLNYSFNNKYFISASIRRDGSSVFNEDVRWGTFYSFGGAWRVDQENFMKNISFINRLKLRATYGEVGNDILLSGGVEDVFLSQERFNITSNAANPAIIFTDIGNAELTWETVENFDAAVEFGLFNNFLEGSVEYYRRNSSELLDFQQIPVSNGLNQVAVNFGDMFNSGWEVGLTAHLFRNGNFNWDVTLQASTLNNEITRLRAPQINGTKRWAEGRSRFDYFLFESAGVDPDNGDQLFYLYELDENGESIPVLDENGNQETTNDWTETQRTYVDKSSIPDVLGSVFNRFSYKGFSLDVLITYGIGGYIYDFAYQSLMHSGSYGRSLHPDILNAWRQPGDITDVPRLENGNPLLVPTNSDRFLTDASFWSLKNVNLGYSFNSDLVKSIGLESLRISLIGENLLLRSERKGLDPQYNLAGTPPGDDFYPARIISMGVNVSF